MSIRSRMAWTVTAAVILAVAVLGTLLVVTVDRELRSSFHAQLDTLVTAVASSVDVNDGRVGLDAHDLMQLSTLHAGTPFALFDRHHIRIVGDVLPPPPERRGISVATVPVVRHGRIYGWVAAWEPDGWIAAFDRTMTLATLFIGIALVGIGIMLARRSANTIVMLLERLEAAFARERRFVADASHELRTPLAVIKAEGELALRRERSAVEYRTAIESIAREAGRLEELTDELLAAARTELDARERDKLDLNDLAREVGERVRAAAEVRDVRVHVETNGDALALANGATIERALLAVVHNAIMHAHARGTVELRVIGGTREARIAVEDDGQGFSQEALEHATERFWRGDAARSRGGSGLGLAIARTMLEANGGSMRLSNRAEGGAVVTLSLPRIA
ncbi:MAG TPA: HAMP domain-containing sensor histidine kinase [Candidatus Tyrphobacter sp.]